MQSHEAGNLSHGPHVWKDSAQVEDFALGYFPYSAWYRLYTVNLKNSHNLKVESYVLFSGIFQDLMPGMPRVTSQVTLGELLQSYCGEESGYLEVL